MGILGKALASYLSDRRGLYSIELPQSLMGEVQDLVSACNSVTPNHALFVTDDQALGMAATTAWADILRWRTDDDRVFVWTRGFREPDSSFRSAVKPFISNRFPGSPSGECTIDLLAEISVRELWKRRNLPGLGDSFEAFAQTAKWVAGVLRHAFEAVGSTPSAHWSDDFLIHWSRMLNLLDQELTDFNAIPEPRHAWEIIRVAGLPVPGKIIKEQGNPFWTGPQELREHDWQQFARDWQEIIEDYVLPDGKISVLLAALDRLYAGVEKTSPWRRLAWDSIADTAAAPVVGQAVFTSTGSPTLLAQEFPVYPVSPIPSWWGVSSYDLDEAMSSLREAVPLQPDVTNTGLLQLFPSQAGVYLLHTGVGTLDYSNTSKYWKAQVSVPGIRLILRETWKALFVSPLPPPQAEEGDAWINPDRVTIKPKGKDLAVDRVQLVVTSGAALAIECDIAVNYTASIDSGTGTARSAWDCNRSLRLQMEVSSHNNGVWSPSRKIDSSFILIVPSPFSPTVLLHQIGQGGKKILVAPNEGDEFSADLTETSAWQAASTPDLLLDEEGIYEISVYDGSLEPAAGRFAVATNVMTGNVSLTRVGADTNEQLWRGERRLAEGDLFAVERPSGVSEIGVIRVKEQSGNLSSGLLSVVRGLPPGQRPPAAHARNSILGQYQDQITSALDRQKGGPPVSLFQYVVSSQETPLEWLPHKGTPSPEFLINLAPDVSLPGIGNGPSSSLIRSDAWSGFMSALAEVSDGIGIDLERQDFWLSGFDPTVLEARVIKQYVDAHRKLIQQAKQISAPDGFWASYPFSMIIVDGNPGADFGQLQAVLLSPLHPARLTWAFSVAVTARKGKVSQSLLGFAEGWNIPYTGRAISATGQEIPLVAVPTDPGREQDFATWSALAVLDNRGLAQLPSSAASLPLPWGGRTGINQKVVEQAINDYLVLHPHQNTLEVDIRSVAPSPRSEQIDGAILRSVGAASLSEVKRLEGGRRVWDSSNRLGLPPTRDTLLSERGEDERRTPFEWRRYQASTVPTHADIAFIENASVHLAILEGDTSGLLGALPLRRFCPPKFGSLTLDQNYSTIPGDDLLGLAGLLREIEYGDPDTYYSLRAAPLAQALGVGMGARWEIMGTFNMDPSLLSSIVTRAQASGRRVLWEWRPSWLSESQRDEDELARRPYYVVARIPASLVQALQYRQGLTEAQAVDMLSEMGYRGIGLASLYAKGGSQESAAAGFFYSMKLLLPPRDHSLQATWTKMSGDEAVYGLLPIDPVETILEELAGVKLKRRADLLAVRILQTNDKIAQICFVPVETKHHGNPQDPEEIPANTNAELKRAREQLEETDRVLRQIAKLVHPDTDETQNPVACYAKRMGLAMLVDLAMSTAPSPPGPIERAAILRNILDGRLAVGVGTPVLLWFAPGSVRKNGSACVVDHHQSMGRTKVSARELYIDPSAIPGLWWKQREIRADDQQTRTAVDVVMAEAFATCTPTPHASATDIRGQIAQAIGLGPSSEAAEDVFSITAGTDEGEPPEAVLPPSTISDFRVGEEHTSPRAEEHDEVGQAQDQLGVLISLGHEEQARAEASLASSSAASAKLQVPRAFIGWSSPTSRWTTIGKLDGEELVAFDLDHPKAVGIFGYMGSGKSYLLGTLIEGALQSIPAINHLPSPLAVVIFNYRRNASDRFELSSLSVPNQVRDDIERLSSEYSARPQAMQDIHVLALPGELRPPRLQEYGQLTASELYFEPSSLSVEDWELLMGEPGSEAIFARTIRHVLTELRTTGELSLEALERRVLTMLTAQSRTAAQLRFEFVRRYLSVENGVDFEKILKPGRALIVDLRQPLFNKDDALRFFLICANQISQVQGRFNKLIVFDEAHEYLSNEFGDKLEARIRQMRHEGTSYVFATQDVGSIPLPIRRFVTTRFVFGLGTRENLDDLVRFAPEFKGLSLLGLQSGSCLVQANQSIGNLFARPRAVRVRPRVTHHGGATRIFSSFSIPGEDNT